MSRKPGCHLTYEERCQIYALLQNGVSKRAIGRQLAVTHSSIVREIQRNSSQRGYRYKHAHEYARERRISATNTVPRKMNGQNIILILTMLFETQASPQQISGRLRNLHGINISHESIYRFIWANKRTGGSLYLNLRHQAKKYNKRGSKKAGRGLIPNRIDIDQRPSIVERKERFGDFELDTIIGANHKGAIVSSVDRASKLTRLRKIARATAQNVQSSLYQMLQDFAKEGLIHTCTADNGKEFSWHEKIASDLGCSFFFAKPYHAWERGLNEHTNGLVRQYFPKGTDFTILTDVQVADVERRLNNRPRKILNFKTPTEVFESFYAASSSGAFRC